MAGRDRMTVEEVVRQVLRDEHADVIRESVRAVARELMEAEVSELVGAELGERRPDDRATHYRELSTMDSTVATRNEILLYGDVKTGYRIVDRLGLTVEVVAHLFGPNRRPTGQRGLLAWWRTGAKTVVPEAYRVLRVR
jgi:hypothetical protein